MAKKSKHSSVSVTVSTDKASAEDRPPLLVVDDEAAFRELCVDILEAAGYAAESASDARSGLERLAQRPFQLVLSDISMPGMDGVDLLKEIKHTHPTTEVILMTAYGGLSSAVEAMRLGAYDYITKPFRREDLLVSVRRCMEKQSLSRQLRDVEEELIRREKLAAVGSFAGFLSHRLRNPLNVILMCAQYLKDKFSESDERRPVAQAIEEKVKTLDKMTQDFIELSRSYEPRRHPEDVNQVLESALEDVRSRLKVQGVALERKLSQELPPVSLDRDLLREALGNLLDNALDAMGGAGRLTVATQQVRGEAVLRLTNTGGEVLPEVRDKLFQPFFTTKERGTGLGLVIARRLVESHGGTLNLVQGTPGCATFEIKLPLEVQSGSHKK